MLFLTPAPLIFVSDISFYEFAFCSKISRDTYNESIALVLSGSVADKRKFVETVELQITLKNYDPQKDKRFSGSLRLPNIPKPRMKLCMLGDASHCDKAKAVGMDSMDAGLFSSFNFFILSFSCF